MSSSLRNTPLLFYLVTTFLMIGIMAFICCSSDNKGKTDESYKQAFSSKIYALRRNEDSLKIILQQNIEEKNQIATMLCYKQLGNYYRENSRFSDAITYHQHGLDLATELTDTVEIIQALNNLGTDFRRIGTLSEASDYHYRALGYAEAFSAAQTPIGVKNRVVAMNGIANVSLSFGYYDEAEKYFRESLKNEVTLKAYWSGYQPRQFGRYFRRAPTIRFGTGIL